MSRWFGLPKTYPWALGMVLEQHGPQHRWRFGFPQGRYWRSFSGLHWREWDVVPLGWYWHGVVEFVYLQRKN